MAHTEADRIAFNKHQDKVAEDKATEAWLERNPSIGVLNNEKYYVIANNELVSVSKFTEVDHEWD